MNTNTTSTIPTPQVALIDDTGECVWEGSIRAFFRDNGMDLEEAREIIRDLRPREDTGHCEPAIIGGGAAAPFYLSLVS